MFFHSFFKFSSGIVLSQFPPESIDVNGDRPIQATATAAEPDRDAASGK